MTTIAGIEYHNWLRYKGRQRRKFRQDFYGVTCRWKHNADRSNMGGKSAFMEGVRFALNGNHRKDTEDEWIFYGAEEGGVTLWLQEIPDIGICIKRTRILGKSTQLIVELDYGGAKETKKGKEAQEYIDKTIGLSPDDFDSSSYFGQKMMSRFITDVAGKRMDIVVGWLGLGPLENAYDLVGEDLAEVVKEIAELEANKRTCLDLIKQVTEPLGQVGNALQMVEVLDHEIVDLEAKLLEAKKTLQLFMDQGKAEFQAKQDFADAKEYHRIVQEGKALRRKIDGYSGDLVGNDFITKSKKKRDELQKEIGVARANLATKRELAKGDFDGVCPVGGIECPVKKELNKDRPESRRLLVHAEGVAQSLMKKDGELRDQINADAARQKMYEEDSTERERLLKEAAKYKPAADRVLEEREPDEEISTTDEDTLKAHENCMTIKQELTQHQTGRDLVEKQVALFEKVDKKLVVLRTRAQLLREAHHIFSKGGAQRQIAMGVFGQIERGANLALSKCNIDLQVKVSWERETGELAKTCIDCGNAFPKSRKEKICSLCGATRGIHFEHKFEVIPSDRSGGAEDLGGIVVQLSAAEWLRRARESGWAVAFLDEPFAHLDKEHSRSLAGHLPGLLRHFGFQQAFISAHSASVMAAMPAMVEIEAGASSSRILEEVSNGMVGRRTRGDAQRDAVPVEGASHRSGSGTPAARRSTKRVRSS